MPSPWPLSAAGGRATGCGAAGLCQQAGHAQRHARERADRQAGPAALAQSHGEGPASPKGATDWAGSECIPLLFPTANLFLSFPPQWYVQATCATQGTGLYDGLDWLSHELSKR